MSINATLSQARNVVDEINRQLICSHQIANNISELPLSPTIDIYSENLSKLTAEQEINQLYSQTILESTRAAVKVALPTFGKDYMNSIIFHAAVLNLTNIGACGEMSTSAAIKCSEFSTTFFITLGEINTHSFILLAEPSTDKIITDCVYKRATVSQLFKAIPENSIIVDPFLNIACFAKDFESNGHDLIKYVEQYRANQVVDFTGFFKNSPNITKICRQAAEVSEAALKILQKEPFDSTDKFLLTKLLEESCTILKNEQISKDSLTWKWHLNHKYAPSIYGICTKSKCQEIKKYLDKLNISCWVKKVLNRDEYCLIIRDIHPKILREKLEKNRSIDSESKSKYSENLLSHPENIDGEQNPKPIFPQNENTGAVTQELFPERSDFAARTVAICKNLFSSSKSLVIAAAIASLAWYTQRD